MLVLIVLLVHISTQKEFAKNVKLGNTKIKKVSPNAKIVSMDFLIINWVQFHKMIVNSLIWILAIELILMKNYIEM